jgi:radical SAM protein with 4Fe4S-binding SPASM domain
MTTGILNEEHMAITELLPAEQEVDLSPPGLNGFTFEPSAVFQARDRERLLSIRLETNSTCNLNCRYCYAESGPKGWEADFSWMADLIDQAKRLGAESIVVVGGGEPTMHAKFRNLVEYIDESGLVPVVFTNCLTMSRNLALFLYRRNATVLCKLDSFRPWVQDFLVRRPGALDLIQRGMRNLRDMGFTAGGGRTLRMGVSFVVSRLNTADCESVWRYCRESRIFPYMEPFTPVGRGGSGMERYLLTPEEIGEYKRRLLTVDREEYGFEWLPSTPLPGTVCLEPLSSIYITLDGNVRPCAHTRFEQHPALRRDGVYPYNVSRMSLADIYASDLFTQVRHIDTRLEGKCGRCPHLNQCIGCRGFTYSMGVNEGLDPHAALSGECRQCFV